MVNMDSRERWSPDEVAEAKAFAAFGQARLLEEQQRRTASVQAGIWAVVGGLLGGGVVAAGWALGLLFRPEDKLLLQDKTEVDKWGQLIEKFGQAAGRVESLVNTSEVAIENVVGREGIEKIKAMALKLEHESRMAQAQAARERQKIKSAADLQVAETMAEARIHEANVRAGQPVSAGRRTRALRVDAGQTRTPEESRSDQEQRDRIAHRDSLDTDNPLSAGAGGPSGAEPDGGEQPS